MKKAFLKYLSLCIFIFIFFIIATYNFLFQKINSTKIENKKEYITSKKDLLKNNINDEELIKFRDYYNLEKIRYVNHNGEIKNSSIITEKGEEITLDKLPANTDNINLQKKEMEEKGAWVFIGRESMRYYSLIDNNHFIIMDVNTGTEKKEAKQEIYLLYSILTIFFIIITGIIFIYYLYNFYLPYYKLKKYLSGIEKPGDLADEENKLLSIDKTDFAELEKEQNNFIKKISEQIKKIENDRQAMRKVYDKMALKNRQLLSLYEFAKTLSFDLELKTIYSKINQIMHSLTKTNVMCILLKKENGDLILDYAFGISNYRNTAESPTAEELALKNKKPIRIKDSKQDKRVKLSSLSVEDRERLNKLIIVPLLNRDENIGVMIIDEIFENQLNNVEEMSTLSTIGGIVGRAINKGLKYKEMNIGLNITSILYKITTLVETNKNLDEIFSEIIKSIKKVVDYESASIYLLNEKNELKEKPEYREGKSDEVLETIEFKLGNGIKALVAQKKETIIIKDVRKSAKDLTDIFTGEEQRIASFASVPMIVGEKLIGVLNLSHSQPNKFLEEDKKILKVFSSQTASTISKILNDRKTEELLAKVTNESITDPLTKAYNRRYMMRRFSEELERAKRSKNFTGLLAIDIDFFKNFNDTYGHQFGDYVLKEVVSVIKKSVRVIDIVCRYGGEEFFVILPNTTREGAHITAERIRKNIENNIMRAGEKRINVTVSVGISIYPLDSEGIDKMIAAADTALYTAKERGRNRVVAYGN